jgi:hypothetical protein
MSTQMRCTASPGKVVDHRWFAGSHALLMVLQGKDHAIDELNRLKRA